jgi:hypothetical protein
MPYLSLLRCSAVWPFDITHQLTHTPDHLLCQVSPLYEAIMAGGGPQEVPGGGAVPLGGTATDRALRVVPKQGFVSAHQLHLAAALSGKDRVRRQSVLGEGGWGCRRRTW